MSDSDSDYVVEHYIIPENIVAPIVNNEEADIFGNFDDNKLKMAIDNDRGSSGEENDSDNESIVYNEIKILEPVQSENTSSEIQENVIENNDGISDEQLKKLLHGSNKTNRYVLYVTNLSKETTKSHLEDFFTEAGSIKSIRIPKNRTSSYAFVEMEDLKSFQLAFKLHNKILEGRQIKIQISEAGKKKSANKKNIIKQKNRILAEMRNESKSFLKSGKSFSQTKTGKKRAWARSKEKQKN